MLAWHFLHPAFPRAGIQPDGAAEETSKFQIFHISAHAISAHSKINSVFIIIIIIIIYSLFMMIIMINYYKFII